MPDPERRILQYTTAPQRPTMIGLRGLDQTVHHRFGDGRTLVLDASEEPVEIDESLRAAAFEELVWTWERVLLELEETASSR